MKYIDPSATIIEASIGEGARVFKNAMVRSSTIGDKGLVSDGCRVEGSTFGYFTWLYPNGVVYFSNIGDYSYAQKNSSIWHSSVGKYCSISWNVSLGGARHDFHRVTTHSMLYASMYGFVEEELYDRFSEQCVVGNDVWIGAGAHVLRGVTVGDGAVIAAGAVVSKDVEPYSIVAGVPAKKIGQRCSDEQIQKLLEVRWWEFPDSVIKENIELFGRELTDECIEEICNIKLGLMQNC